MFGTVMIVALSLAGIAYMLTITGGQDRRKERAVESRLDKRLQEVHARYAATELVPPG